MALKTLNIKSRSRTEFIDITEDVQQIARESGIISGVCVVYTPHTTAGLTINEGADPSVKRDIITALNKMVSFDGDYQHAEGNSAAHIKCLLTGVSLNLIIEGGKLELGTWQSLYFCEYDGPRHRRVIVKIV